MEGVPFFDILKCTEAIGAPESLGPNSLRCEEALVEESGVAKAGAVAKKRKNGDDAIPDAIAAPDVLPVEGRCLLVGWGSREVRGGYGGHDVGSCGSRVVTGSQGWRWG